MVALVIPRHWVNLAAGYVAAVPVMQEHVDELAAVLLLAGHKRKCGLLGSSPRIIDGKYSLTILHKGHAGVWYLHTSERIKVAEE